MPENHAAASPSREGSHSPSSPVMCAGRTDIGKTRTSNQDQFLIADLHKNMHLQSSSVPFENTELFGDTMGKLLVVADGMGGAQAGEVASAMAVQSMAQFLLNSMHWLYHPRQPEIERFVDDLKSGAHYSHETLRRNADRQPGCHGMGTTLVVAYLMWPMLYVLHVGDSRCYILRDGSLQRLTRDQTLAQHLYDRGHLSERELQESPYNHVLLSAIGIEGEPDAIVYKTRLQADDRILLCTDGVNAHLSDREIGQTLAADMTPDEICGKLIQTANERGGTDNITAIVALARPPATDESPAG